MAIPTDVLLLDHELNGRWSIETYRRARQELQWVRDQLSPGMRDPERLNDPWLTERLVDLDEKIIQYELDHEGELVDIEEW